MTQEQKRIAQIYISDKIDDIHDYFCTLREQGIRVEPSEFINEVLVLVMQLKEDLCDNFDEPEDD